MAVELALGAHHASTDVDSRPHGSPGQKYAGRAAAAFASIITVFGAPLDVPHPFAAQVLVVVCSGLAGALAGGVYFITEPLRAVDGWKKSAANITTLLAFGVFAVALLFIAVQIARS